MPKQMVKTEWAQNPLEPKPKQEAAPSKSMGQTLNGLAGVETRKNLFQENKKLDKEAFLKMFMEQLKYQDPTKPVDNEKVAQQMAMFSQLEQQMLTNKNLETMIAGQNNTHLMALNLMGKEISVDQLTLHHNKNEPSSFNFKLGQEASSVKVSILNEAGNVVDQLDLGSRMEGDVEAKWIGSAEDGRPAETGKYFYSVEATDLKGQPINVESKLTGKVTGVSTSGGKTMVHVGEQKVDLLEVSMVKEAPIEAAKPLIAGMDAKNLVGTKSETTVPENMATSKGNGPQLNIGSDVANELMGSGERPRVEDLADMLNPMMPIFTR